MFQFPGLPLLALFDSGESTRALPRVGFPIRKSRDRRLVSTSPGLIAAAHVLHRLSAPRHPPCALVLLIRRTRCVSAMEFSRCARPTVHDASAPATRKAARRRSLKTQQRGYVEVDVDSRRARALDGRTNTTIDRSGACRSKSSGIPRKE